VTTKILLYNIHVSRSCSRVEHTALRFFQKDHQHRAPPKYRHDQWVTIKREAVQAVTNFNFRRNIGNCHSNVILRRNTPLPSSQMYPKLDPFHNSYPLQNFVHIMCHPNIFLIYGCHIILRQIPGFGYRYYCGPKKMTIGCVQFR